MMEPSSSWVARWQQIDRFHPGMYAMAVIGTPPSDVIELLHSNGISYVNRDTSVNM